MKTREKATTEGSTLSPMCQVSVGRHETCTWVECTCWCHAAQKKDEEKTESSEDSS